MRVEQHAVTVLDTSPGEDVLTLRGHKSEVNTVAFSPDGKRLATGDHTGTIRIWNSVPYRDRLAEYETLQAAAPQAKALVEQLHAKLKTWSAVAKQLRDDASLDPILRRAALNEVLKCASGSPESHAS